MSSGVGGIDWSSRDGDWTDGKTDNVLVFRPRKEAFTLAGPAGLANAAVGTLLATMLVFPER